MSLKEIEKEIKTQGEKEIKRINKETKRIIKRLREEIEKEAELRYLQTKLKKEKSYEIEIKKIISDARLMKKNRINSKKAEILDEIFSKAKEKILNMNDKEKEKLLENLVKDKDKNFPNSEILIDTKYGKLLKKKVKNLKITKIDDFGVIIKSKDNTLLINRTLSNLMNEIRTKLEPEIVKILF